MPDPLAPARDRRRPRFSLRALMALVLVVGGGVGWVVNRVRTQQQAVAAIRAAGGTVQYDFQFSTDPGRMPALRKVREPPAPAWLRRWLGDDLFRTPAAVAFRKPIAPEVLAAVARLDGLASLYVDDATGLGAAWPALGGLARLVEIRLAGPDVDDGALAVLARLPRLASAQLLRGRATDGGVAALAGSAALRSLTLANFPAPTDAGMARALAGGFPNLDEFRWVRAPRSVTATVVALAEHHRGVRELMLTETTLAAADLARIGELIDLTTLHLSMDKLTDAGLVGLEPLRKLANLSLNGATVGDAGMKAVGRLANLDLLDLTATRVGDPGVADLAGLARLKVLRLGQTPITDAAAEALARLPALERLIVLRTKWTDAALVPLRGLATLRQLGLGGSAITPEGAAAFRAARPEVDVGTLDPRPPAPPRPAPTR